VVELNLRAQEYEVSVLFGNNLDKEFRAIKIAVDLDSKLFVTSTCTEHMQEEEMVNILEDTQSIPTLLEAMYQRIKESRMT
jgi:hypothetical protein